MRARLALLGLAGLSACMGPRPAAPPEAAITAPATWREPAPAVAAPIAADWWNGFGDPVLTRLVEQALAHNDDLGEAAARVSAARAQLRLAHGNQGPEVDFTGIGGYTRQLEVTGPLTTSGAEVGGTIAYDFDLFGRLRSASKAARAQLLATQATRDAMRLAVVSTVARGYIMLLAQDRQLAIARDTLAARAASLKLQQRLSGAGYASQLDLRQAEAEYQATAQLVPQVELAVTQSENALSVLIGVTPGAIPRGAGGLDGLAVPAVAPAMPAALLRRRPDIAAAEDTLVAADHTLDAARAAMMPNLALTGNAQEIFAHVLPTPESAFLIGGSVLAPIFDSGRRRAAADTAAARRDAAAFAYRAATLEAFKEVEDAIAALQRTDEQRRALQGQVSAEQASLKIATERYRAGYASYLNQIDAQRALLSAQLSLTQADASWLAAHVEMMRALGGGWSAKGS
jgi:outer membrane protein, multidrug efflux system